MRKIINNFVNGSIQSLSDLGLENVKVKRVYTIIDESILDFTNLEELKLKHNQNVFLEDKVHDWDVINGQFKFYGHSGSKGDKHHLLIEYQV